MKKRVIKVVVLLLVFVAALTGFSIILNQGTDDMTADMGSAKLPVISFEESGYQVNPLVGYKTEMNIPLMRDSILPMSVGTSITAEISGYSGKIHSLVYDVMTLDGKEVLKSGTISDVNDTVKLELGDSIADDEEKVLRIILKTENEENIYYYTRVVRAAEFNVQQCLEFAEYFHNTALEKENVKDLAEYYNSDGAPAGNGLQKVTLSSDLETIAWGELTPKVVRDMVWEIKESNQTYTSISLKYKVKASGDAKRENLYNVTEFFKVRFLKGKITLESYERTMNEVFEGKAGNFSKNGIILGLVDENVPHITDEKGNHISFVQEREVWHYSKKENEIALLFSFASTENDDMRNYNDEHSVRLLDMDNQGNTVFAVYGYMNRGKHEGETGVAVYYYDIAGNYVQEKAFISSRSSGEIVEKSLNQLTYYNEFSNVLYAIFEGTFYKVDLESQVKEVIQDNLESGQYVSSVNGRYVAYQKNGNLKTANRMEVWDLEEEKNYVMEVVDEELIRPLGFVNGDTIYGIGREADIGKNAAGEEVTPFYKLEIRNEKNEVAKSYEVEGIYIEDIEIVDNMITMERMVETDGIYKNTTQDSITNNEDDKEKNAEVERIASEKKGFQIRLTSKDEKEDGAPKLLKPKQMLFERAITVDFENVDPEGAYYVYAFGTLQGIYDRAGTAIEEADAIRGVVVTSGQEILWERGNRMLSYQIEDMNTFAANAGENSLAACIRRMLAYEQQNVDVKKLLSEGMSVMDILNEYSGGEAVDLTGCVAEELCYIVGKGTPVLAMTGSDSAVLLVGYDQNKMVYIDPAQKKTMSVPLKDVEKLTAGSQGAYYGYVK